MTRAATAAADRRRESAASTRGHMPVGAQSSLRARSTAHLMPPPGSLEQRPRLQVSAPGQTGPEPAAALRPAAQQHRACLKPTAWPAQAARVGRYTGKGCAAQVCCRAQSPCDILQRCNTLSAAGSRSRRAEAAIPPPLRHSMARCRREMQKHPLSASPPSRSACTILCMHELFEVVCPNCLGMNLVEGTAAAVRRAVGSGHSKQIILSPTVCGTV